jgi:hypothetical protein
VSGELGSSHQKISQSPSAKLQVVDNKRVAIAGLSPSPDELLRFMSFSHFVELMRLDDPLRRAFYEIEGIKGCWSTKKGRASPSNSLMGAKNRQILRLRPDACAPGIAAAIYRKVIY